MSEIIRQAKEKEARRKRMAALRAHGYSLREIGAKMDPPISGEAVRQQLVAHDSGAASFKKPLAKSGEKE